MAYNSLKSYWIWRRKKEAEEKEFRALGVDENIIAELHDFDRIAYNSDDRFYKRLYDIGNFYGIFGRTCTRQNEVTCNDFVGW